MYALKIDMGVMTIAEATLKYIENSGEAIDNMTADTFEYYSKAVNGNIAGTADQQ